ARFRQRWLSLFSLGGCTMSTTSMDDNRKEKSMETKAPSRYHERLTSDNAALLLIDHQVGLFTGVRDIPVGELKHNVLSLATAAGYDTYAVIDASGTFSETKRITGLLRMVQAGVIVCDYATVAVEMLKDNASPKAGDLYAALDMPWAGLVGQLAGAFASTK